MARKAAGRSNTSQSKLARFEMKLTPGLAKLLTQQAKAAGMPKTEFVRRAIFIAMKNPKLLSSVEDMEAEYRDELGPSRWR